MNDKLKIEIDVGAIGEALRIIGGVILLWAAIKPSVFLHNLIFENTHILLLVIIYCLCLLFIGMPFLFLWNKIEYLILRWNKNANEHNYKVLLQRKEFEEYLQNKEQENNVN